MGRVWIDLNREFNERQKRIAASHKKEKKPQKKAESTDDYELDLENLIIDEDDMTSCLMSFLEHKPEELAILKTLIEESNALFEKDCEKTENEIISLVPQSEQIAEKFTSLCKSLQEMGLDIDFDRKDEFWFVKQPNVPEHAKFDYHTSPVPVSINGVALSKEIVSSGKNPYSERLQVFSNQNPDCEEQLLQTQREVEKLKTHRLRLKISQKEQQRLQELESKLATLQSLAEKKHKFEEQATLYASLSEDQKATLSEYFDSEQEMRSLSTKVESLRERALFEDGYGVYYGDTKKKYKQYVDGFVAAAMDKLSLEEVQKLEKLVTEMVESLLSASPSKITERASFSKQLIDDNNFMKKTAINNFTDQVTMRIKEILKQAESSKQY